MDLMVPSTRYTFPRFSSRLSSSLTTYEAAVVLFSFMPTKFTPGGRMYARPYKATPYRLRRSMRGRRNGASFASRVRKVVQAEIKFHDQGFSVLPIVGT